VAKSLANHTSCFAPSNENVARLQRAQEQGHGLGPRRATLTATGRDVEGDRIDDGAKSRKRGTLAKECQQGLICFLLPEIDVSGQINFDIV
jgi:hypothetical protein